MLILARRVGEAILIDGGVRVVVLGVDGGGVRLGIEAPSSIGIVREEIVQRITEENVRAGATEIAKDWLSSLGGSVEGAPVPPGSDQEGKGEGKDI